MAQSITLTASMRSNLSSLKGIQKQMDTTQERLSTGKKVNSAIDNASSFYQSRALTNRAADLDALLDSMGQGIQTIQAANEGIEAVTAFVDQLKSVATSAFAAAAGGATGSAIDEYQDQYNAILKEVKTLIEDSGYQGINLLNGSNLNVTFDENREHILTVEGDDVAHELNTTGTHGADAFSWDSTTEEGNINWHANDTYNKFAEDYYEMNFKAYTGADADAKKALRDADIDAGKEVYKYNGTTNKWDAVKKTDAFDGSGVYSIKGDLNTDNTTYARTEAQGLDNDVTASAGTAGKMYVKSSDGIYNTDGETIASYINKSLEGITEGLDYLRSYTSSLGNNYSIIQTRQDFTEALVDVLETGSDNLVLADMNEESANYLALQTRQQLAINSLSLASQSAQNVLKLF